MSRAPAADGFTLFELLLTLVIIVVVAALSVPVLQRSFSGHSLRKSADLVRSEFGRARVQAIQKGKVYAFFYQPGSGQFAVVPFLEADPNRLNFSRTAPERSSRLDFGTGRLPDENIFVDGEVSQDSRSMELGPASGTAQMVLFYPNGTSQDAKVTLQNEQGDVMQVILRGVTGSSTIVDLGNNRQTRGANR